jgi:hypothetical protein
VGHGPWRRLVGIPVGQWGRFCKNKVSLGVSAVPKQGGSENATGVLCNSEVQKRLIRIVTIFLLATFIGQKLV